MSARFAVHGTNGSLQILDLAGREEWALSHLLAAGSHGCTPIDTPGPRWSDYVFKLRRRGIDIATITESHGGAFPGHHARYILRSKVNQLSDLQVAA
jgi:hypothetical protein